MRWLLAAVFALGCSEGQVNDAGVTPDAGRSVSQWQRTSLGSWVVDMQRSHDRMRDYVDRNRATLDGALGDAYYAASDGYRDVARTVVTTDAGPDAQLELSVNYLLTVRAPAYCREVTAYIAATGMQPLQPAIRCDESVPARWWERWP